jgi:GNAT superfamily N-acetyltransferase
MIKIRHIPIGEEWEDRLLVAIDDSIIEGEDVVVGSCRVWDNFSKLTELFVVPGKRNAKIGFLLLVEGAALAKVHGHPCLIGYCKKKLLPFYEQYGIQVVKTPKEEDGLYEFQYPFSEEE